MTCLCGCTPALSSYGVWGLLFFAVRGLLARGVQQLWPPGLVTPWPVESSQTRDGTCVPCTGRRILNHWTTREALILQFSNSVASSFIFASPSTFMHWRRKWQPTLENPRDGEPGGLPSMGSHRVGHDWSDLAAAAAAPSLLSCVYFVFTPNFSAVWLINSFSFFLSIKIIFRTSSPGALL